MTNTVEAEVARRRARGHEPMTLAGLKAALASIGYKLDRSCDARGTDRYMTGEFAGCSYPATNLYVVEADTGISAFHYHDARRDENFRKLQEVRFEEAWYAVVRGRILAP